MNAHNTSMAIGVEEDPDYVDPIEITILRQQRGVLIHDIIPSQIIPHLTCLTRTDEGRILTAENKGSTIDGALTLLDLLVKKRTEWYEDFLKALRNDEVKLGHLAASLEEGVEKGRQSEAQKDGIRTFEGGYSEGESAAGNLKSPPSPDTAHKQYSTKLIPRFSQEHRGRIGPEIAHTFSSAGYIPDDPPPPYTSGSFIENQGQPLRGAEEDLGTSPSQSVVNIYIHKDAKIQSLQIGDHNVLEAERKQDNAVSHTNTEDDEPIEDDGDVYYTAPEVQKDVTQGNGEVEKCTLEMSKMLTNQTSSTVAGSIQKVIVTPNYEELIPRSYQEELGGPACRGLNSIICAPTGTGKTHVAMMIAKRHMENALASQARKGFTTSGAKVIFLVHRIPLLNQTYKRLKMYLPLFEIGKLSGASSSNVTFEKLVEINDIIITTTDILKNSLKHGKSSMSTFSLIIIDECHHAMKNHPYNIIMAQYLKEKFDNKSSLPQIVGLTASPGTGSNSELGAARDHILKLCANLDAGEFVTVKNPRNKAELEKFVTDPDKVTTITTPRNPDPFRGKVEEIMANIEGKANFTNVCPPRGTQPYETFIILQRDEAIANKNHETAQCCDHLNEYNKGLLTSDVCRMSDGLLNIDEFYNERRRRGQHKNTPMEDYLYRLYRSNSGDLFEASDKENDHPNPKVVALKQALKQEVQEKGNDFRGIIFVKTRVLASAVLDCIKEDQELQMLRPSRLTGVKTAGDESMTQAEQDSNLRKFADGDCKLLIATSVAEEGLDIKECHMVIRYNYATNEISMRQARGRARATQSKEHFIGDEELASKDHVNVFLDQQMEKAIQMVQGMPREDFLNAVLDTQKSVIDERSEKELTMRLKRGENEASTVKLFCRGCDEFVFFGNNVYLYGESSHIIKDMNIIECKIEFREHTDKKKRDKGIKKIYCKVCSQDWGNTLPSGYPVVKIESFTLEYADGSRKRIKKWKSADFTLDVLQRLPPFKKKTK
ncbi:ATP-dependent RNA helicase DHX58-like [Saccoglossus kowalevskii]|uniref:RNA helicase n=1 Tax=Saccoglossus kowalevskii TaxID=10224 RepID=A0ABM0GUY4_SACKO|nr:PREDICTED: interferon-induced helicase C domain-containing protein 1-like [Saccoglossus kowalevskii]